MSTEINLENSNISVKNGKILSDITAPSYSGIGYNISNFPGISTQYICKTNLVDNSTVNDFTTATIINVFPSDTISLTINEGGFTCTSSGVVVPETGIYLCFVNVYYYSSTFGRNAGVSISVNGTVLDEIGASGFIRATSGINENSAHVDTLLNLVAGDEVGLAFTQLDISGQVDMYGNNSSFVLYRIE